MRAFFNFCLIFLLYLGGCTSQTSSSESLSPSPSPTYSEVILDETIKIAVGQTIYVPVYSSIYQDQKRLLNLTATLSVRNTEINHPIIITSVDYYDTMGKLVKKYLDNPIQLNPLASANFVVDINDTQGGIGANFLVNWVAQQTVSEPLVEAVMISTISTQGLSFISRGQVINSRT